MRISRIYVDETLDVGSCITLPRDKAHYVRNVLRLKSDQRITLFNGRESLDYPARLSMKNGKIGAEILSMVDKNTESTASISLLQAMGKSVHLDFIVQKATELGVSELFLFNSERTQSPVKNARLEKKRLHWQAIAESACEQSNRNRVPAIHFETKLESCLARQEAGNRLLLDFNGENFATACSGFDTSQPFRLLIGAEGGLSEGEVHQALQQGFKPCLFGPRTLRMETAALSGITLLQHFFGDMG